MKSASYLDLHLEIDGKGKLLTKLYNKRDDFAFRIVNFPSSEATSLQHLRMECLYHSYVMPELAETTQAFCIALALTNRLMEQGYVATRLKSSLQKCYGRHHGLVDRHEN